jgi:hypothetical protein
MRHLPPRFAVIVLLVSGQIFAASAACLGTGALQTCTDAYGNNYTVNRMGSMTQMYGNNSSTGSNWSQTSQSLGNMTIHNGITNGNPWYMNKNSFGGITTYSGMNSAGEPFSYTCTRFGCN